MRHHESLSLLSHGVLLLLLVGLILVLRLHLLANATGAAGLFELDEGEALDVVLVFVLAHLDDSSVDVLRLFVDFLYVNLDVGLFDGSIIANKALPRFGQRMLDEMIPRRVLVVELFRAQFALPDDVFVSVLDVVHHVVSERKGFSAILANVLLPIDVVRLHVRLEVTGAHDLGADFAPQPLDVVVVTYMIPQGFDFHQLHASYAVGLFFRVSVVVVFVQVPLFRHNQVT